jgi:hypothetical protein
VRKFQNAVGASCQLAPITRNPAEAGSFGHVFDGFETCSQEFRFQPASTWNYIARNQACSNERAA